MSFHFLLFIYFYKNATIIKIVIVQVKRQVYKTLTLGDEWCVVYMSHIIANTFCVISVAALVIYCPLVAIFARFAE